MMQLAQQTSFATTRASALRTSAVPRPTTRRTVVVRAVDGEKTPEGEWNWPGQAQLRARVAGDAWHGLPHGTAHGTIAHKLEGI
jgi:hypothetical protein